MHSDIDAFRHFNRFYTNHTGLLQRYLPGGKSTLCQARILLEIGYAPGMTAAGLERKLTMDRGQLSRVLKQLEKKELLRKGGPPTGRKPVPLQLTDSGYRLLKELEQATNEQLELLLAPLDTQARQRLITAMEEIERTLSGSGQASGQISLRTGRPGDLGWVLMRHAQIYAAEYDFSADFEAYVLRGMLPFAEQWPETGNQLWIAERKTTPLGSLAVAQSKDNAAQLRWFLVEPQARGYGLGKQLLHTALTHCREQGFSRVFLLTVNILPAARHLYESFGFHLVEATTVTQWGRSFQDERWELELEGE